MKKVFICICVFLTFLIYCTGTSLAGKEDRVILKMGTNAPDEVGWAVYLRDPVSTTFQRVTNSEAYFSWYWGGLMGGERDNLQKMSIDQLQGTAMSGNIACPEMCVLSLPYISNNYSELQYVDRAMRPEWDALYEKYGNVLLMQFVGAYCIPTSTKTEMRTPDDFKKSRFTQWSTVVEAEIIKALGASPIPVPIPEVTPSIRAGVADAMLAPPAWWVGSQLYTITKAMTPSNMYFVPGSVIVTKEGWNRVPEKYHDVIKKELTALEPGFWEFGIDSDEKCLQAMFKWGVKEIKLTPEEIEEWKRVTRPIWDKLADKLYPRELLNKVLFHLEEYRAMKNNN